MFFDDLTDGSGLFDIGGDIWQITPDGLGGFIAMPFDPVADLAAGLLMPVILALPIIGILMVGQPLVIALAAAAVGFVIAMLLSALLHPIAGYGVFATCLTYLFGTLSWAVCDKFETHNPIFLFGYIGIAALVLIAWALLGSGVEEITDDVIPSLLGIGTAIGGFITSAMLFFTALGENRAKYSVYAFRIMHYLLLACLVVGLLYRVIGLVRKGSGALPFGALLGSVIAFALGLIPLVATGLLGAASSIITCAVFLGLYVAIVALTPSLGKDIKATPAWVLMPLMLGSLLYLVAENASGMLIQTDVSTALLNSVTSNPLLVSLWQMTGRVIVAFTDPVARVFNGVADFVAGIFDQTWPSFAVADYVVMVVVLALAAGALMVGATLRTSVAKASHAK